MILFYQEKRPNVQKTAEKRFCLNADMLPSYISTSIAEKVGSYCYFPMC